MSRTNLYGKIPNTPGVYLMKGARGEILYIGKAANLRRRVSSYFERPHDYRIQKMVSLIRKIDVESTDTALEALILEAEFIKKHQPPYNVLEKDDKSFLYVEFTKEKFPRVLLVRGKSLAAGKRFGPFIYGNSIREALKILRRVFPFGVHPVKAQSAHGAGFDSKPLKPCFDYQIGLCPGTCIGATSVLEYGKNIRNLTLIFEGKKRRVLKALEKEMKRASKNLEFERAAILRRQIFGLKHIQDVSLIETDKNFQFPISNFQKMRIEGYDISNISGTSAVGSMVVFRGTEPDKNEYRKFKIKTIMQSDDVGMMKEVLRRRFHNPWPLPDLILIDGGLGQVNAARQVLGEFGLKIPVMGIAKGPTRKKNEFVGSIPNGVASQTLIRVRDEAHRFAITYHRALRSGRMLAR
jgi:excinuclease ABC subunit C